MRRRSKAGAGDSGSSAINWVGKRCSSVAGPPAGAQGGEQLTAAYGDDSSRSALTFMPPVTRAIVSLPVRSVT